MSVEQAFNQSAGYYNAWMRKALPGFDDLFSSALQALPFPEDASPRVLDLGAGTGLFSSYVLQKYPQAQFTLVDLADGMLAVARERFQAASAQFIYSLADIRSLDSAAEYDLVISSLAIHHLEHAEKQDLFRRIHAALRSPGLFLNIDQIKPPRPNCASTTGPSGWSMCARRAQAKSKSSAASSAARLTTTTRCSTDQLCWLQAAGFSAVDILYKNHFIGLFYAVKEEA